MLMNQTPTSPQTTDGDELTLVLGDVAQLFVAPPANPLSPSPAEALGVAGVEYLLSRLHLDRKKQQARELVLLLPPEKASSADAERLTLALHRQTELRIEDQRRELRNTYRYGWRVAGLALILLASCLAISHFFASDFTEGMRPLIRKTFEYGFEIIGWVILWHPADVLVFSPLAIRSRLRALKTLASIKVIARPLR